MASQATEPAAAAAKRPSSWASRLEGKQSWKSPPGDGTPRKSTWAAKGSAEGATPPRRTAWAAKRASIAAAAAGSPQESQRTGADLVEGEAQEATPTPSASSSLSTPAAAAATPATEKRRNTWRAAAKAVSKKLDVVADKLGETKPIESSPDSNSANAADTSGGPLRLSKPIEDSPKCNSTSDADTGAAGGGALSLAAAWRARKSRSSLPELVHAPAVAAEATEATEAPLSMVPEATCNSVAESQSAGLAAAEAASEDSSAFSGSETFEDRPAEAQVDDMTTRLNQLIAAISQATGLELSISPGMETGAFEVAASPKSMAGMAGGDASGLMSCSKDAREHNSEDAEESVNDGTDNGAGDIESGATSRSTTKSARSPPPRLGRISSEKVLKMLNIMTSNIAAAELEDTCEPSSSGVLSGSVLGDSVCSYDGERQRRASAPPVGVSEPSSSMRRVSARQPMQRQSQDVILRLREQEAENVRLVEQLDRLRADLEALRSENSSLHFQSTELNRQHQEELSTLRLSLEDKRREVELLHGEKLRLESCQAETGSDTLRGSVQKLLRDNSSQRAPPDSSDMAQLTRLQRENKILQSQLDAAVELRDRLAKNSNNFGLRGAADDNLHQCLAQLQQDKHELEMRNSDLEARLQEQELKAYHPGDLPSRSPASPEKCSFGFKTPEGKHAVISNDSLHTRSHFSEDLLRVNVNAVGELQELRELAAALQCENQKLRGQVGEVAKLHEWLQRADPDTPGRDDDSMLESKRCLDASFLHEALHDDLQAHRDDPSQSNDTATCLSEQAVQNLILKQQELARLHGSAEEELVEYRKLVDNFSAENKRLEVKHLEVQQAEAHAAECHARDLVKLRAEERERYAWDLTQLLEEEKKRHAQELVESHAHEQRHHAHEMAIFHDEEHKCIELARLHEEEQRCRAQEFADLLEEQKLQHVQDLAKLCEEEQACHSHQFAAFREEEFAVSQRHSQEVEQLFLELQNLRSRTLEKGADGKPTSTTVSDERLERKGSMDSIRTPKENWGPKRAEWRNNSDVNAEEGSDERLERKGSAESIRTPKEKWGLKRAERKNNFDSNAEEGKPTLQVMEDQFHEVHKTADLERALHDLQGVHRSLEIREQHLAKENCGLKAEEKRLTDLLVGSEAHASLQDATVKALRNEESRLEAREEVYQSLACELRAERKNGPPSLTGKRRSQEVREEEFLDLTDEIKNIRRERQKVQKYSDEMQQSLQAKDSELARLRDDTQKLHSRQQDELHRLQEARDDHAAKLLSEVCELKSEHEQSLLHTQEAREWKFGKLEGQIKQLRLAQERISEESQERLCCEQAQMQDLRSERRVSLQELADMSNRFQSEEQDSAQRHKASRATLCGEKSALEAQCAELRQELTDVRSRFAMQEQDLIECHQASLSAACGKKSVLESQCAQELRRQSDQFKSLEQESSERHAATLRSVRGEKSELETQYTELKSVLERDRLRFADHETNLAQRHSDALTAVCKEKAQLQAEHAELLKVSVIEQDLANRNADALFAVQAEKTVLEEEHAKFRELHGQEVAGLREVLEDARAEMVNMAVLVENASKTEEELLSREMSGLEIAEVDLHGLEHRELCKLREAHSKLLEEHHQLEERLRTEPSRPDLISPIQVLEPPSAIMSLPDDSHDVNDDDGDSATEAVLADEEAWPSTASPHKLVLQVLDRLSAVQKIVAAGRELSCSHWERQRESQQVAAVHIHIYMRREECNNLCGTFTYVFV